MLTTDISPSVAAGAGLFAEYVSPAPAYDEAFAAPDRPRAHWQPVIQALHALGSQELAHRWEQARQMLYEHGVTYNVHGPSDGLERPWRLDLVPFVCDPREWAWLEAALLQRARLLNAVLADVYGAQTLVQQGVLPAELVLAHAGFLRPCHGMAVPGNQYLHLYAVDLSRTPDGRWWVVADRTQSPAGAGYAAENRVIVAQTLSDLLRGIPVQPLKPFFDTLHQTLCSLAPQHRDNPRMALLTPGPGSPTYFEHVYLARLLGYTLVQGADLLVRDQGVFLKTLAGLRQVDVLLRRQDDLTCDPLGLHHDSLQGTVGLVQAIRAGRVTVANALGSGWAETAALLPFLPRLCRHVLGEDLRLASLPTWWCGQPEDLAYVLEHSEQLEIALALPTARWGQARPLRRIDQGRGQRLARLRAFPYAFVAQARLERSTVPVWQPCHVQPRPMLLRVFIAATEAGYVVMPGGLTRVASAATALRSGTQGDNGSKDTWVLSTGPAPASSLLAHLSQPVALRRSGYDLPSRVADDFLWLGRYAERAEGAIRVLRSMLQRATDTAGPASRSALPQVLRLIGERWACASAGRLGRDTGALPALQDAILQVLFARQVPDSVQATLVALHQAATRVRDRISVDAWGIVTRLEQAVQPPLPQSLLPTSEVLAWLNQTLVTLAAFSGLGMENMTRGPGWRFLDMGRRLERAMHTVELLASLLRRVEADEAVVLEAVLEIADSAMTYRSRYLTTLQFAPVLDLLLSDASNPRSVAFQLAALADHVEHLPRDLTDPSLSPTQRLSLRLATTLQLAAIPLLCEVDAAGERPHLLTLLSQLGRELPALADTITHQYLSHAEPSRHLAAAG